MIFQSPLVDGQHDEGIGAKAGMIFGREGEGRRSLEIP